MLRLPLLCLVVALGAGCTGQRERTVAVDLFTRLENGDCKAFAELNDLAQKGQPFANAYLGLSLQKGVAAGCIQPAVMALQAYSRVVKNLPEAAFNAALLELNAKRAGKAEVLLRDAAGTDKKGLPAAMVRLAQLYETGAPDVVKNDSLAAQYFERASKAGDLYARLRFAQILLSGKGRSADKPAGLELLESCARKGLPDAMLMLHELRKAEPARREEAGRWLGMYASYRPAASARYNAFLATMTVREQKAVRDSVNEHSAARLREWAVPDYTSPLAP
jgi:TPR repeat protein